MQLADLRDIAVIILAAESIILTLVVIILMFVLIGTVRSMRKEVTTVMTSAQKTANTIQSTTAFVSNVAVLPVVRVAGIAAAASRFAWVLFRRSKKGEKKHGS